VEEKEESPQGYSCNNVTNKNLDVFSRRRLKSCMNSGASNRGTLSLEEEREEEFAKKPSFYRHVHENVHSM
jgi:hypothetical protein